MRKSPGLGMPGDQSGIRIAAVPLARRTNASRSYRFAENQERKDLSICNRF